MKSPAYNRGFLPDNKQGICRRISACQKCICPYGHEIHTGFRQFNYYMLGKEFWAIKKLNMDMHEAYLNSILKKQYR